MRGTFRTLEEAHNYESDSVSTSTMVASKRMVPVDEFRSDERETASRRLVPRTFRMSQDSRCSKIRNDDTTISEEKQREQF